VKSKDECRDKKQEKEADGGSRRQGQKADGRSRKQEANRKGSRSRKTRLPTRFIRLLPSAPASFFCLLPLLFVSSRIVTLSVEEAELLFA
jgi:hypothetical protein